MILELDIALLSKIRNKIIRWYKTNGRSYPWRETSDIYQVLIAEMMLRRTTATAVVRVYPVFMKEYPDIATLAKSNPEEIQDLVQSLGLQVQRASDLSKMAKKVVEDFGGDFSTLSDCLHTLPGVGPYVSSAVRNFALGIPDHMVDGNILHFLKRTLGVHLSGPLDKDAWLLMKRLGGRKQVKHFYWGIIDFVALICLRKSPHCSICPLSNLCVFHSSI